jgi:flagellar biosynthesis protein FlhA
VRILLDSIKVSDPAVLEEMATTQLSLTELHHVLSGLLDEGVPIRDLVRIVEAVTERAKQSKDQEGLLEAARSALGPAISALYAREGVLPVITLDARLERSLVESVRTGDDGSVLGVDAAVVEGLVREVRELAQQCEKQGREPVLLCASRLRPALRRLFSSATPRLGVLSINEVGPQVRLERIGVVNVVPETV